MSIYPDTSFLCAVYREQGNTLRAREFVHQLGAALPISPLLEFEFAQAVRLEIFRHRHDHRRGYSELEGMNMLARFAADMERGALRAVPVDFIQVLHRAARISENRTIRLGCRSFDVLHIAAALELGAREFLSFDAGQRTLAETEGLLLPV